MEIAKIGWMHMASETAKNCLGTASKIEYKSEDVDLKNKFHTTNKT